MEDRIARKLDPGPLAHQGLLDDLDVGFLDLYLDVFEFRHGESRIGVVTGAGAWWSAAVTHAALAWKNAAFLSVPASIIAASIAQ